MGARCSHRGDDSDDDDDDDDEEEEESHRALYMSPDAATLAERAHCRPPKFHAHRVVPDAEWGCYDSTKYHRHVEGTGAGYWGSSEDRREAFEAFQDRQAALLKGVGLGPRGVGDWRGLSKSGAIFDVDGDYLRAHGFEQVVERGVGPSKGNHHPHPKKNEEPKPKSRCGGGFTLDDGLHEFLTQYGAELAQQYEAAHAQLPGPQVRTRFEDAAKAPLQCSIKNRMYVFSPPATTTATTTTTTTTNY